MRKKQIDIASLRRAYVQYGFYVVPVAVLTVVFLLTILVLIPGIKQGIEASRQLKTERGRLSKLTNKVVGLQRLDRADLALQVEVVEQVLPSDKGVGSFLLAVRRVANETGVGLLSVDLSPGELESKTAKTKGSIAKVAGTVDKGSLPIEVKLVGPIKNIEDFLSGIQETVPKILVKSLEISGEGGSFQAKVSLEGNYWARPSSLGPAEKPLSGLTVEEQQLYQKLVSVVGGVRSTGSGGGEEVPVGNVNLMQ